MNYRVRVSCPDCTGEDPDGCNDGAPWELHATFATRKAAEEAGSRATRDSIYEYEVIEIAGEGT